MSDATVSIGGPNSATFLRQEASPALPPPALTRGPIAWIRKNLFPSPISSVLTVLSIALLIWIVPDLLKFLLFDAVWSSETGEACRANPDGACWSFVAHKFQYFRYGSYPAAEHWRVDLTEVIGGVLIVWLLVRSLPKKNVAAALFFLAYPILGFILLRGSTWLSLPVIDTQLWGGILITLLMSLIGIVFSLPLGVLLALGRRSKLPIVKSMSTIFIEVVRGVPFIAVLFMANVMLPMFLPDDWSPDRLLRPMIGTALFSAAYMAEVVRGGMQAMPKGQFEGASAVGLGYWQTMRLIILPQALTLVIPGVVSTFIGLFMDTTLVSIVGIFDFLKTIEAARIDPVWAAPTTSSTGYAFAAIVFWVCCFGMSRYSQSIERRLRAGRRH